MLELDETLFVEHKANLGQDSANQVIKAVASFANTLGGWLLIGIEGGTPTGNKSSWTGDESLPLVDVVRDRLRGEIDPLPAFEARVFQLDEGAVGVVRVYESSDTPHIVVQSGAVFIREVAGDSDATKPRKPGAGARGRRIYRAEQIRSREQMMELSRRGERSSARVHELIEPPGSQLPLIAASLGPRWERVSGNTLQPVASDSGLITVKAAPYTPTARFRSWATTADASAAALGAAEILASRPGLTSSWANPHPSGIWAEVPLELASSPYRDALGDGLPSSALVVIDAAGVIGAGLRIAEPESDRRRARVTIEELANDYLRPVLQAAAQMLIAGEMLGRSWFQLDMFFLGQLVMPETADDFGFWIPIGTDITLPGGDDDIAHLALLAANAAARSARIPAWDPAPGPH